MCRRILAAVGWTSNADAVLDQTRRLAELSGAQVHVLRVQPMDSVIRPSPLGMLSDALAEVSGATAGQPPAEQSLDDSVAVLVAADIHAKGTLVETPPGNTAFAVLQHAGHQQAELIVIGCGQSARPSAPSCSTVACQIVQHAACPVLIVP